MDKTANSRVLTMAAKAQRVLLYKKSKLFLFKYRNPATKAKIIATATVPE